MRSLSNFMPSITEQAVGKKGLLFGKLIKNWAHIVSPEKAKLAIPEKISFSSTARDKGTKTGATLFVATTSAYASVLDHERPIWIEKINLFFGYEAVENIKFVHNLKAENKPSRREKLKSERHQQMSQEETEHLNALLANIEDENLKQALYSYGYSLTLDNKIRGEKETL